MISIYYSVSPGMERIHIPGLVSYNHETVLIGGYRVASFSFNANLNTVEQWIFTGVGRHIDVFSRYGNKVWEGMVNEISFNVGPRSVKIGPFLNISNRINVGFSHPNYGIPGDTNAGTYDETDWDDNLDSQRRYGVMEELISGGTGELPEMEELRASRLRQQAEPIISETLASGTQGQEVALTVSCIGYSQMLEKQIYNLAWQSGWTTIDLSDKVLAILAENKFFVDLRTISLNIQSVDIPVPPEDSDNRTAWGIISDHITKSSRAPNIRCGMFDEMTFNLQYIEEDEIYVRSSGTNVIKNEAGHTLLNSEILPGGHMSLVDFSVPASYQVTSVRYDLSGDSVSLNYQEGSIKTIMSGLMLGGIV